MNEKMRPSKESVAYNLELFEPIKKDDQPGPQKKPTSAFGRFLKALLMLLIAATVIFSILSVLSNYARLTELSTTASKIQRELNSLQEETARLKVDIDKKTNLKVIEGMALEDFGMIKVQDYQREYIDMKRSDKVEIVNPSPVSKFFYGISDGFKNIMEYLGWKF